MRHTSFKSREGLFTDAGLAAVYEAFDDLHSAASEGVHHKLTPLGNRELVGWLQELVYTAQETIAEIERANGSNGQPTLTLIK